VNEVGAEKLPVQRPLKPIWVEPPVARLPFHGMFVAVIAPLVPVQLADQPSPLRVWPDGRVNCSVQPLTGSWRLLMVMLAVKPPAPGLSVHVFAW
jgi:hypothetical protein